MHSLHLHYLISSFRRIKVLDLQLFLLFRTKDAPVLVCPV